jgi:hypothetical protein
MNNMNEIIFLVEEAAEGGFTARALGESIYTEADDVAALEENVRDAVRCHFDPANMPRIVRLRDPSKESAHRDGQPVKLLCAQFYALYTR